MAVSFPNYSRSYDETGGRVRFWGYDGAMEVSFFVEAEALSRLQPSLRPNDETGILSAFDQYRDRIMKVAAKVYSERRRGAQTLGPADF